MRAGGAAASALATGYAGRAESPGAARGRELDVVVRLFVVRVARRVRVRHLALERVLDDLLALREEDLALAEREHGEHEEHGPHRGHDDGHDEVPDEEALQLEDVAQHTDGGDPANCEESMREQGSSIITGLETLTIREGQRPA